MSERSEVVDHVRGFREHIMEAFVEGTGRLIDCNYFGHKSNARCIIGEMAAYMGDSEVIDHLKHLNGECIGHPDLQTAAHRLCEYYGLTETELVRIQEANDLELHNTGQRAELAWTALRLPDEDD